MPLEFKSNSYAVGHIDSNAQNYIDQHKHVSFVAF